MGYPEKLLVARVVSTLLGIIPLIFLPVWLGVLGVAIVWVVMDLIWSLLNFYFCKKYVELHVDWKKTIMFLISASIAIPAILIEIQFLQDIQALLVIFFTILLIYIVLIRLFGLITERELSTALAFMPDRLRNTISRIICKN